MLLWHFVSMLYVFNFYTLPVLMYRRQYAGSGLQQIHKWVVMEYDFPPQMKQSYIDTGLLIPENLVLINLDAYKNEIFVQLEGYTGVPSTVNRVVKRNGKSLLKPFPSLQWHQIGNCHVIQDATSIEIDSNNGHLWVLDNGKVNANISCPRKIIIFDIHTGNELYRHVFPSSLISTNSRLIDLSLDRVNGFTRYAYIPDTIEARLIVLDTATDRSWAFAHPSMTFKAGFRNITVNNETIVTNAGINGIATTSDFKFVYYFPVASLETWQIPTFVLRNPRANNDIFDKFARMVGFRPGHAVGLTSGSSNLFFTSLENNNIIRWNRKRDTTIAGKESRVLMKTLETLTQDDAKLVFVDAFDVEDGNIWYTTNKFHKFLLGTIDFSGNDGPNFSIGRVFVKENSYLLGHKSCSWDTFYRPYYFHE